MCANMMPENLLSLHVIMAGFGQRCLRTSKWENRHFGTLFDLGAHARSSKRLPHSLVLSTRSIFLLRGYKGWDKKNNRLGDDDPKICGTNEGRAKSTEKRAQECHVEKHLQHILMTQVLECTPYEL